jgi:hypothetical protein
MLYHPWLAVRFCSPLYAWLDGTRSGNRGISRVKAEERRQDAITENEFLGISVRTAYTIAYFIIT